MKSVSEKKSRGHRTSKSVKSNQSYSNGHLPYHCSFWHLARALLGEKCAQAGIEQDRFDLVENTVPFNIRKFRKFKPGFLVKWNAPIVYHSTRGLTKEWGPNNFFPVKMTTPKHSLVNRQRFC